MKLAILSVVFVVAVVMAGYNYIKFLGGMLDDE